MTSGTTKDIVLKRKVKELWNLAHDASIYGLKTATSGINTPRSYIHEFIKALGVGGETPSSLGRLIIVTEVVTAISQRDIPECYSSKQPVFVDGYIVLAHPIKHPCPDTWYITTGYRQKQDIIFIYTDYKLRQWCVIGMSDPQYYELLPSTKRIYWPIRVGYLPTLHDSQLRKGKGA